MARLAPLLPAALLVLHGPVPGLRGVLPRWHHRRSPKGFGGTSIIEAINCSLRQRYDVLVRKSYSFSKSIRRYEARIKIVTDNYNNTLN